MFRSEAAAQQNVQVSAAAQSTCELNWTIEADSPAKEFVLLVRGGENLVNALLGDAESFGQYDDTLTRRMALTDFGVPVELLLGLLGLENRRQGNAVVEPSEDALNGL